MLYSFLLVLLRFGRVFTVPGFVFAAKLSLETFGENRFLLSDLILVSEHCRAFAQLGACLSDPWSRHTFQNTVIPALPWFHPQIHTLPDWYWHLLFHFPTT